MCDSEDISVSISSVTALSEAYQNVLSEIGVGIDQMEFEPIAEDSSLGDGDGDYSVYVLKLENDFYYVGSAGVGQCWNRVQTHFDDDKSGAAWTGEHHPVDVVEISSGVPKEYEKQKTLEYMKEHGWENVRGWSWSKREMENPPKVLR